MVDANGVVVEVLQTSGFATPTEEQLDAWINTYDLTVTSVIDRDPDPELETFDALGIREQVFVIDLGNMTIVYQFAGSVAGIGDPSTRTAIDDILQRLGR